MDIIYLLVGGAFFFWLVRRLSHKMQWVGWEEAAASCGLEVVESGPPLRARTGPLEVRFDTSGSSDKDTQLAIVVPGPPDFKMVRIRPEAAHPYQYQWAPEIETGDARFDRTFWIEGPAPLVLALLDARARQLLLLANDVGRLEISLGEIRSVISNASGRLPYVLSCLLEAGRKLAQPMDVFQRVAENASRDPEAGVRLQNLLLLVREIPGDPLTLGELRTACADPSPQVRLRAAKELGAEGRGKLLEFAESEDDDTLSAGAVSILDRELPFERVRDILFDALRRRRLLTIRACLETLGKSGDAAAVAVLAEVLEREDGDLAAAAALALGTTGNPAAEPPLLLALQREDTQVAAAGALARIGTAAAVLPLEEAAESAARNPELVRAARQAIAEIQSRLPGASPGQLSLALSEAGKLSLAQAEAGQLSLATDHPAGHLSLPPEEPERSPASGEGEG